MKLTGASMMNAIACAVDTDITQYSIAFGHFMCAISCAMVDTVLNAPDNPNDNDAENIAIIGNDDVFHTMDGDPDCPDAFQRMVARHENTVPRALHANVPRGPKKARKLRNNAPTGANNKDVLTMLGLNAVQMLHATMKRKRVKEGRNNRYKGEGGGMEWWTGGHSEGNSGRKRGETKEPR